MSIRGMLVKLKITRGFHGVMKHFALLLGGGLLAAVMISCSSKQASVGDERLKWNLSTTAGDYDRIGQKDAKWDDPAKAALTDYAKILSGQNMDQETRLYLIGSRAEDAMKAGCREPLGKYLYCRFALPDASMAFAKKQEIYKSMAQEMQLSAYAPLRKFYAELYAAEMLWVRSDT